jgi:hypothetical protein
MNESSNSFFWRGFGLGPLALGVVLAGCFFDGAARAADDPCVVLGKLIAGRVQLIQHIQGYKEKKPTADDACSAFTSLAKVNSSSVAAIERDGAWCRAPDGLADNLKSQQTQIETAKTNACKAAADQKKAAAAGATGQRPPLGGTGDILGGPMKLPQGAL